MKGLSILGAFEIHAKCFSPNWFDWHSKWNGFFFLTSFSFFLPHSFYHSIFISIFCSIVVDSPFLVPFTLNSFFNEKNHKTIFFFASILVTLQQSNRKMISEIQVFFNSTKAALSVRMRFQFPCQPNDLFKKQLSTHTHTDSQKREEHI